MFEPIEKGYKNYKMPNTAMLVDDKGDLYSIVDLFKGIATGGVDLTNYYTKTETYSSTEVDTKLDSKANTSDIYTRTEIDTKLNGKANASAVYKRTETYTKAEVDALINALREELVPPVPPEQETL